MAGENLQQDIVYRYTVKVKVFDKAGNIIKGWSQPFRLRKDAVDYKTHLREEHDRNNAISIIDVIKTSNGSIVEGVKSKHYKKLTRKRK